MVILLISDYEIKNDNGEEVLYLYFDFNYEFSKFDFFNKNISFLKMIENFIKNNKISFRGVTVLLISGGILFGSMNYSKDVSSHHSNLIYTPLIESVEGDNYIDDVINIKEEEVKDIVNDDKLKNDGIALGDGVVETVTDNDINRLTVESKEESIEENAVDEMEDVDYHIYVNVRRSNDVIISLELEEYVVGVVGAEMPASFHSEALKAQAVIARTYALKAISQGRILSDNESTQSYKSNDELQNMWGNSYSNYYSKIKEAVDETRGVYLMYHGSYIEAVYHSTSNGKTENASNVWGNYFPYLVCVDSPFDTSNPSFQMTKEISYEELSKRLGYVIDDNTEFQVLGYTEGGRVQDIMVNSQSYTGVQFRNLLGLRSSDFELEKVENGVIFRTKGYGHGVGMSQYGANGMAKNGYSYQDILKHYYTGVDIYYES